MNIAKCEKCGAEMQRHKPEKIEYYKCSNKDCDNKFTLYSLDVTENNNTNFA